MEGSKICHITGAIHELQIKLFIKVTHYFPFQRIRIRRRNVALKVEMVLKIDFIMNWPCDQLYTKVRSDFN